MGLGISNAEMRNHRYVKLRGDEISLVTTPAILDEDEIQKGVGIVVMKLEEHDRTYPAWVQKLMSKEGEDLREAITRLLAVCRAMMVAAGHAKGTYDCDPIHVGDDHVLMADHYGENPFSGNFTATRCDYTQDAAGDFHVGRMTKMRLRMMPEEDVAKVQDMTREAMSHSDETAPHLEDMDMPGKGGKKPPEEGEMAKKVFEGVEVQGVVVKTVLHPGQEFTVGTQVAFKVGDDGAIVPGEGFVHGDDGVVRPWQAAPVESPPTPPAAPSSMPEPQAAVKSDDRVQVVVKLIEAGRPFRFTADGSVEVLPELVVAQKSDDGTVAALATQVERLTQQVHGTDGRFGGNPPTYDDKDEQDGPARIFTDPQKGFFTVGFLPR